jgi:uncharacterized protein YdaU (DUF1376 family)
MGAQYIPFYVGDYLRATQHLSTEEHGAYLLLLFSMWANDGVLPFDDRKLARVARLSLSKWRHIRDEILPFFEIEDGFLTHSKMKKLQKKYNEKCEKLAENGSKGGRVKSLKNKEMGLANATNLLKQPEPEPEPYIKHSGNITDSVAGARQEPPQQNNQSDFQEINQEILEPDFSQEIQIWQPDEADIRHAKSLNLTDREIRHAIERARNNNFTISKSKLFREYCFGALDTRKLNSPRNSVVGGGAAFGANARGDGQKLESLAETAVRLVGAAQKRGYGGRI